ncbi:MAG: VIT1/CCC1 transporter family protein [Candidatus Paceibacterota bacterium]
MKIFHKLSSILYFRNFVFGVEDSLVSTVGLLSGIAVADVPRQTILLTGGVLIFVEAVSMAAGSFLSEYSAEEYASQSEKITRSTLVSSAIMFFSYFISGLIVLFPYMVFVVPEALKMSIVLSIFFLFLLGAVGARISRIGILKNGLRMAIIGGMAIIVGIVAGSWLSSLNR